MTMTKHVSAATILTGLHTGNAVDPKKLGRLITTIASSGRKLDEQIHAAAVACIYRSMPHAEGGHLDCSLATRLMNAMPKGSRAKALAAWFEAFSNIRCKRDDASGQWKAGLISHTSKMYVVARPEDARLNPFWSVDEKSTDPKAFDLDKAIASLLKRADKEGVTDDRLAAIRKLVPVA